MSAQRTLRYYRYCLDQLERDISEERRATLTEKAAVYRNSLVARYGEHFGECSRCHRLLTDPVSIARSLGSECVKAAAS